VSCARAPALQYSRWRATELFLVFCERAGSFCTCAVPGRTSAYQLVDGAYLYISPKHTPPRALVTCDEDEKKRLEALRCGCGWRLAGV